MQLRFWATHHCKDFHSIAHEARRIRKGKNGVMVIQVDLTPMIDYDGRLSQQLVLPGPNFKVSLSDSRFPILIAKLVQVVLRTFEVALEPFSFS